MYRSGRTCGVLACALLLAACASIPTEERPPVRSLGVSQGPELVFKRPVAEIAPQLAGASATGVNGRVGSEAVFWTYRLADGREVLFHACAPVGEVDCALRETLMCARGTPRKLVDYQASGDVRRLNCQAIGNAAPGDLRPGCSDYEFESPLVVGLSECPAP